MFANYSVCYIYKYISQIMKLNSSKLISPIILITKLLFNSLSYLEGSIVNKV